MTAAHMEGVLHAIAATARLYPDHPAMRTQAGVISYAALVEQARRLAATLITEAPEGVIAVSAMSGTDRLVAELGCLWAGRTFLPLAANGPYRDIIARRSGVGFVIGAPLDGWAAHPLATLLGSAPLDAPVSRPAAAIAWITTTSGSTGIPKSVPKNASTAATFTRLHLEDDLLRAGDVVATFGESWHHFALAALMIGARIEVFDLQHTGPAGLGDWLETRGITNIHTYTAMFRLVLAARDRPLAGLQTVCVFGEPLTQKEIHGFNRISAPGARLINGYGSSEVGLIARAIYPKGAEIPDEPIPAGQAFAGVEITITDADGAALPEGALGEIVLQGPHLPCGYIGQHSPAFSTGHDGRACFQTGDIGRITRDGRLTVLGRRDDMIKIRGTQVLLRDVQKAIELYPGVTEAMVTAYQRTDGAARICAHLVADAPVVLGDLVQFLKARGIEPPARLFHYAALPRTRTGKVDRRALALPVQAGTLAPHAEPERIAALRAILSDVVGRDDFGIDTPLDEIGGDSHDAMRMLLLIEERFGCEIRMDDALFAGFSLNSLARLIDLPKNDRLINTLVSGDARQTIFACPTEDGAISHIAPLLRKIAGQRRVKSLRLQAFMEGRSTVTRLPEMGRHAANAILASDPGERVIVIGFSAGATFAFETVRHLQTAGITVAGLILLDPSANWALRCP